MRKGKVRNFVFAIIGIIAIGLVVPILGSNKSTYHSLWTIVDSSEPPKWDKISSDDYFSANLFRFTKPDNFIELELIDHDYDTVEFYYNTFENNPVKDAPPASIDTKISVVFGKKAGDLKEIFSKHVSKLEKKKLKINLPGWSEKTVILKINVKNNPTTGIELFALHFFKKKKSPKRVMLISLDTVGAGHLGLYGYKNFKTSPCLEKIVKDERNTYVFTRAFGQSWWTLPSHVTMFTGLYPGQHKMTIGSTGSIFSFSKDILTLHQILQTNKIYTYHSISHSRIGAAYGYDRGLNLYSDFESLQGGAQAENIIKNALEIIEENSDKDIFLFLHFFDAHSPYTDYPKNYKELSPDIEPIFDADIYQWCAPNFKGLNGYDPRNRVFYKEKFKDSFGKRLPRFMRAYDLGIRLLDWNIYNFYKELKKRGLWEGFDILITSDHGEEFFEHGGVTHTSLYDSNIKLPFILKLSEKRRPLADAKVNAAGKFINTPIEAHVASFWTILDFFDLREDTRINRKKRPTSLFEGPDNKNESFSEFYPDFGTVSNKGTNGNFYQCALIKGNFKIILTTYLTPGNDKSLTFNRVYYELFNTGDDPGEQINLAQNKKYEKTFVELKEKIINRVNQSWKIQYPVVFEGKTDEKQIQILKTLGYIK